jgi:hypothetical protein
MSKVTMSLNQIREFHPCESGWKTLLKALGKTSPDDEPIPLEFIIESNGIKDAIWCMRVNWFDHKELYMEFVNSCIKIPKDYAYNAYASAYAAAYVTAAAAAAADAVDVTDDAAADAAAYAAAAVNAAAYYRRERDYQKESLLSLLKK